jgi:cytidylate kinase
VRRRRESEIQRYMTLYGVDIGDSKNFDLVIDTSKKTPSDITAEFKRAYAIYSAVPHVSAQN